MRLRPQRGFTLIEMMVVVALIGVLSALAVSSIAGSAYGADAPSVADEVDATFNFAKLRAITTRRRHRVVVTPNKLTVYQGNTTGLAAPSAYQFVQSVTIPSNVSVWNASTTVQVASGATVTQNTSLTSNFDFLPDGSSTGGTVFLTDLEQVRSFRVVIYRVTGASYAREGW